MTIPTKTKACKHGTFTFFTDDSFVGKSLDLYGDYSEDEVSMFDKLVKPDHICIEVGSNIGALTVPLAKRCKKLYAFEPHPETFNLLVTNIVQNELSDKVKLYKLALGKENAVAYLPALEQVGNANYGGIELMNGGPIAVDVGKLDNCIPVSELDKIKFIKIDAEGCERLVLEGAATVIARSRPLIYVENDRKEKSGELVGWLIDHGYRCYWHKIPLFYEANFAKHETNVFGNIHSLMLICIPEELNAKVVNMEEVDDHRVDNQMYHREYARAMKRVAKDPADTEPRFIAAHFANLKGDVAEAKRLIAENLKLNPSHVGTLAVEGLLALQAGDYEFGWPRYEIRYHQIKPEGFGARPHYSPVWDGSPTDAPVLLWAEQGFGDSIMFGRFILEALKRAPNAFVEMQPQLYELFETSKIVPPGRLFRIGRAMPEYAFHCAIPSLPAMLGLKTEADLMLNLPASGKYLHADRAMVDSWLKRKTPRIGICAKGGVASERGYSRDLPDQWAETLARKHGPFITLVQEGQFESYADTAACIEALDLVVTVDTSVAHLAGALGTRTFLMLSSDPDFRWQRDRSDSVWYPSMTIFRQRDFMDWAPVIDDVSRAITTMQQEV